jgi:hypothetical protein
VINFTHFYIQKLVKSAVIAHVFLFVLDKAISGEMMLALGTSRLSCWLLSNAVGWSLIFDNRPFNLS